MPSASSAAGATEEAVMPHVEKRDLAHRTGKSAKVKPHVDEASYEQLYKESIKKPTQFWDKVGRPDWPAFG
jgi:hypothetical protein